MSLIKIKSLKNVSNDNNHPTISIYTLVEATSRFIADADIIQNSKKTYIRSLQAFFNWLHEAHGDEFRLYREHIIQYKEFLDQKGLKPYTRSLYLVAVRRFFEWTETMLLYPNIAKGIKVSRGLQKSHNKDSLSEDNVRLLLQSVDQSTIDGMRDYALIYLLIHTGLRLIEIQRALISDIEKHETGKYLLWVRGKGRDGKDDFVVLVHEVITVLLNYIMKRNLFLISKEPLFCSLSDRNYGQRLTVQSLSRIVKHRLEQAHIKTKRISAHSLRHTFGVLAIQSGVSLYEVQLAMRHMSAQTTQIYLGDIEKKKRLEGNPEEKVSSFIKKII